MRHRIQLYLDPDQYRWLKQRAGRRGSMAGVVREVIDEARAGRSRAAGDLFIHYLLEESPADSGASSTVVDLDRDLHG